jgi:hypothetical protein
MKIHTALLTLLLSSLMLSQTSQAVTIGLASFTINEAANTVIDEDEDLEWLRWDQTLNMSLSDTETAFPGFTIATSAQLTTLFNKITGSSFLIDPFSEQYTNNDVAEQFIQYFGKTLGSSFSRAIYRNFFDNSFAMAEVSIFDGDSEFLSTFSTADFFTSSSDIGIALVRSPASSVPLPAAAYLFVSAFATLIVGRRRSNNISQA